MSNGIVIYRGPSMLDGAPIVAIATGLRTSSTNAKTGNLIQTWILREDVAPVDAVKTGQDASICGACQHRGTVEDGKNIGRSCYVSVFQAPQNVWKSYHRGLYPMATDLAETFAGRAVRLGAYGDPAAVPESVWEQVTARTVFHTGYTHQWRIQPSLARFCMASCDTERDRVEAKLLGFRCFRVRRLSDPVLKGEVTCPASAEAGKKTICALCKACGGTSSKARADIVIYAHGSADKVGNFARAA